MSLTDECTDNQKDCPIKPFTLCLCTFHIHMQNDWHSLYCLCNVYIEHIQFRMRKPCLLIELEIFVLQCEIIKKTHIHFYAAFSREKRWTMISYTVFQVVWINKFVYEKMNGVNFDTSCTFDYVGEVNKSCPAYELCLSILYNFNHKEETSMWCYTVEKPIS